MSNSIVFKIENDKGEMKQWKNVSIPVKYGKFLDEQLDHATVDLVRVKKKEFKLLSKASITIKDASDESTEYYLIANDNSFETPVGSGIYNHTLTLIELTKYLECFPLENLCFTHSTYKNGLKGAIPDILTQVENERFFYTPAVATPVTGNFKIPNIFEFITPKYGGITELKFPDSQVGYNRYIEVEYGDHTKTWYFTDVNGNITHKADSKYNTDTVYDVWTERESIESVLFDFAYAKGKENGNTVRFRIYMLQVQYKSNSGATTASNIDYYFNVQLKNTVYPVKPYTIQDVITRILDVVEPLRKEQSPRFSFSVPEGEDKIFNQVAPEFTFTGQNLREALQTVGGFIHAEPRLTVENKIVFDFYGGSELATYNSGNHLNRYKYKTYQGAHGIDQACNTLDSYTQNLVNRTNENTVGQPYKSGYQTTRTETAYVRVEENDSAVFPTQYPIDSIGKFEVKYNGNVYDITKYLYEINIYNYLSSYSNRYYDSKNHALHYTIGGKYIKGFFYKRPNAISESKERYSITNIINDVTGLNKSTYEYQNLEFSLTYSPIYSARIRNSKQNVNEWLNLPRTINYAQSDNSVEVSYFGEHLKGAVERLGTVEKTVVMNMRKLTNIPKAGQLWDDEYYISAVMVEVQQDLFEVSCSLSKNFNRISKYIGVQSHKRVYEVSETMVQQRHSVYTDYLMFTTRNTTYSNAGTNCFLTNLPAIKNISVAGAQSNNFTCSAAILYGQSKADNIGFNKIVLPVMASAFGNSMQFTWEYKDNYSAGAKKIFEENQDVSGYFTQEVEYADYYGRLYWQNFSLLSAEAMENDNVSTTDLPKLSYKDDKGIKITVTDAFATTGDYPILKRKDNREALKETYCIELVTDQPNFVIGSAFASKNPLISHDINRPKPKLYILPHRINKFATKIDLEGSTAAIDGFPSWKTPNFSIGCAGVTATETGKAWCYAIPEYLAKTYEVEDDDGNVTTITEKKGGELLFGENIDVKKGDIIGAFNAYVVHDVYDFLKTKIINEV